MSEYMSDKIDCRKIGQIECQTECQNIGMSDRMPDQMLERMPKNTSDRMPENRSDGMPGKMSSWNAR
jgi:hypothetical protein